MAASANLQSVPAVIRSEQGGSFFRRTTSCLSFNRVPFLEAGMGGSVPCNCVIELHGHPGTGKSFTLSEMAVEALVSGGSTASADQRTVLWFDADLKFNPDCIMKCAKRASSASGCTLTFDELLSRVLVFKPSDVLQLVATLQGMRLGADLGTFPDIGIPIMVIVDGVSPLFVSSRAAGDATHSMFDQVPHSQSWRLLQAFTLILCCAAYCRAWCHIWPRSWRHAQVSMLRFGLICSSDKLFLFSPWQQHRSGFPARSPVIHFAGSLIVF
jgi:hypothetical protein